MQTFLQKHFNSSQIKLLAGLRRNKQSMSLQQTLANKSTRYRYSKITRYWPFIQDRIVSQIGIFASSSSYLNSIHQIYDLPLPRLRARPINLRLLDKCRVGILFPQSLVCSSNRRSNQL